MEITPDRARIFRITHIANVPWILANGLYSQNSGIADPNFVTIGNTSLIADRSSWPVKIRQGQTLGDYIPFYFTPYSIMMMNIITGFNGIRQIPRTEIVILVTSLHKVAERGLDFLFTDRHAKLRLANFYDSIENLSGLAWNLWQARDFKRDPDDPEKLDRYQAEALVHSHLPVSELMGIVCYGQNEKRTLESLVAATNQPLQIAAQPKWYL